MTPYQQGETKYPCPLHDVHCNSTCICECGDNQKIINESSKNQYDGNWMDEHWTCKVCGGEIPHGHSANCDIYKYECKVKELERQLAEVTRKASDFGEAVGLGKQMLESRTKERDESYARESILRQALKLAKDELETFGSSLMDTAYHAALNQMPPPVVSIEDIKPLLTALEAEISFYTAPAPNFLVEAVDNFRAKYREILK